MSLQSGIACVVRVRGNGIPEDRIIRIAIALQGEPKKIEYPQLETAGSLRFVFYSRANVIAFKIKLSDVSKKMTCDILC